VTYDPHKEVADLRMKLRTAEAQLEAAIKMLSASQGQAQVNKVLAIQAPTDYRDPDVWSDVLLAIVDHKVLPSELTLRSVRHYFPSGTNGIEITAEVVHNTGGGWAEVWDVIGMYFSAGSQPRVGITSMSCHVEQPTAWP
jgi:hypothetical protein